MFVGVSLDVLASLIILYACWLTNTLSLVRQNITKERFWSYDFFVHINTRCFCAYIRYSMYIAYSKFWVEYATAKFSTHHFVFIEISKNYLIKLGKVINHKPTNHPWVILMMFYVLPKYLVSLVLILYLLMDSSLMYK